MTLRQLQFISDISSNETRADVPTTRDHLQNTMMIGTFWWMGVLLLVQQTCPGRVQSLLTQT